MDDYVYAIALGPDDRFAIGQPLPSSDDPVLPRGDGNYSDDVSLPGLCRDGQNDPLVEICCTSRAACLPCSRCSLAANQDGCGAPQPKLHVEIETCLRRPKPNRLRTLLCPTGVRKKPVGECLDSVKRLRLQVHVIPPLRLIGSWLAGHRRCEVIGCFLIGRNTRRQRDEPLFKAGRRALTRSGLGTVWPC
jgi:hypothetical protein